MSDTVTITINLRKVVESAWTPEELEEMAKGDDSPGHVCEWTNPLMDALEEVAGIEGMVSAFIEANYKGGA